MNCGRRRLEPCPSAFQRPVGRDHGREQRDEHEQHDAGQAEHGRLVAQQPAAGVRPQAAADAALGDGIAPGVTAGAVMRFGLPHEYRIRGLR